jgi:hypothetical protein
VDRDAEIGAVDSSPDAAESEEALIGGPSVESLDAPVVDHDAEIGVDESSPVLRSITRERSWGLSIQIKIGFTQSAPAFLTNNNG